MTLLGPKSPPIWWRIPTWLLLTGITVVNTHGTGHRAAAGVLMTGSWVALQFVQRTPRRTAVLLTVAATGLGVAACFPSTGGVAPIAVCVAAALSPHAMSGPVLRAYTVATAAAFGVTIALAADSWLGLFAGLGIPPLVQRTVDNKALIHERDRAQALLAEAERGREAEAQTAALRERSRIAREMHDVLAHSLAGLSVQLQAVRAVAAREKAGPAVLDPLDKAAVLAQEGLAEARAAVGTLRDPAGLGIAELPALVERHPGEARLTVAGTAGEVAADTGHAVYRAVQEALTNAARHAPGTTVGVALGWRPDELEVTVRDTGPLPGRAPVAGVGTGLGLAGMTERVAGVGGRVEAGPDGTGWQVRIVVPAASGATS